MFIDWLISDIKCYEAKRNRNILDHITESSNYHWPHHNLQYNPGTDTVWISMGAREGANVCIII